MPRTPQPPKLAPADIAALTTALDADDPGKHWRRVLELFLTTGVADTQQLAAVTNLSRGQLDRCLARFEFLAGATILAGVTCSVPRPGSRGRPPGVYTLGPAGAALLRAQGHPQAQPCGLADETTIAHARAVLAVRLAALAARLPVRTEAELAYGHSQVLRPDNLVTLPSGGTAIFETEQAANITLLRRLTESLQRKAAFFQTAPRVSPVVRLLINLPPGRVWDRTVHTWEQAAGNVATEHGDRLPFHLWALPLADFLQRPDWAEPPDPARWTPLAAPAPAAGGATAARQTTPPRRPALAAAPLTSLPEPLRRRSAGDDQLILAAFWQQFQAQAPTLGHPEVPPYSDPVFFQVLRLIHIASHDPYAAPLNQAAHPHVSLYLLRTYLEMHPRLREALSKALVHGSGSVKWSVPTIILRMQVVVHTFLRYHGWRADGPLCVYPELIGWDNAERPGSFGLVVQIRHPELLMEPGDEVVPGQPEVRQAEMALAWVLWALFSYGSDLGLKIAPFW